MHLINQHACIINAAFKDEGYNEYSWPGAMRALQGMYNAAKKGAFAHGFYPTPYRSSVLCQG